MVFKSSSDKKTKIIASDLAQNLKDRGAIIALVGELGAGKTTFVQGFAGGLGIKDKIISPTFVLMRQHKINDSQTLYHIDLYRLPNNPDIDNLGLSDLFQNPSDIILIEWAEKIKDKLPSTTRFITITKLSSNTRQIEISELATSN
jgi:tRNA threonylcarbamoyladenosine biosynthesis protein TsaE